MSDKMLLAQAPTTVAPSASVPNPAPKPPPGLDQFGTDVIAWTKYGVIIAGVVALLVCAGMIMLGRRNRNQVAQEGVLGSVYVLGGLALAGAAAVIVGTFL